MMARFFPKSLAGQILLAMAMALLVAQAVNAVLLLRAQQDRAQSVILTAAAFRIAAAASRPSGSLSSFEQRRPRQQRGGGVFEAANSPIRAGEQRQPAIEAELRRRLAENAVAVRDVQAVRRGRDDPRARRWMERREERSRAFGQPRPDGMILIAVELAPDRADAPPRWLVGRVASHPVENRLILTMALQTLVIFTLLFGALALLLRRITRPLAQLTQRIRSFDASRSPPPPLSPSGPADIARLIAAQNDLEGRISALLDEKDVMLGAIGHDLKTPLAALRVRVESVESDVERARMAETISDITRTLDDILSLARVGRPTDPLEPTDLAALAASIIDEFEDLGQPVTAGDLPRIIAPVRVTWLRRALRNLITNAVRYGGSARLTLDQMPTGQPETGRIRLVIADNGPGIPDDQIEAMMQPFTRLEASRNSATGGSGLGLTLARAIAAQHGGSLTLRNRRQTDGAIAGLDAELLLPF